MRCAESGTQDAVFVFLFALVFALIEIEIEGKDGWAAKLPTARNVVGHLTLYHVYMVALAVLVVSGFVVFRERLPCGTAPAPVPPSPSAYLLVKIVFHVVLYLLLQDFLWFVFNPHYTLKGYGPGTVGWHGGWWGGVPAFNFAGLAVVAGILFTTRRQELFGAFAAYAAMLLAACAVSPAYHAFHAWIH